MSDEDRIAEIIGDWFERRDRGEEASPEAVVREHPELERELREHFEILGYVVEAFPRREPEPALREVGEYRVLRMISRYWLKKLPASRVSRISPSMMPPKAAGICKSSWICSTPTRRPARRYEAIPINRGLSRASQATAMATKP